MNDFSEVRVQADEAKNMVIRLVGANVFNDDVTVTIPAYLVTDFRNQVDQVFGF